jgi:hypothetical protein
VRYGLVPKSLCRPLACSLRTSLRFSARTGQRLGDRHQE